MLDRTRLAKLLALSTSSNDSEALAAARKANEIVKGAGLSWEEVLAPQAGNLVTVTVNRGAPHGYYRPTEDWEPPHLRDKVVIEVMFRSLYASGVAGTEFGKFVDSVHEQFLARGRLTAPQFEAIRRAYQRTNLGHAAR